MSNRKFIALVGIFVFLIIGFFCGFNWILNPYRIYASPHVNRLNNNSPSFWMHERLGKSTSIILSKSDMLILGTSRTERGINPENLNLQKSNFIIYNASLQGGTIYEIDKMIKVGVEKNNLKGALIGLDFDSFGPTKYNTEFDENYFNNNFQFLKYKYLFLLDSLLDSLKTLYASIFNRPVYVLNNGFCTGSYELKHASEIGHRKCCLDIESGFAKSYSGTFKYEDNTSSFEPYRDILELAYKNNIKMTLFISPIHSRLLEVLNKACGYDKFETWKRELVMINEKIAKKYGRVAIVIWDFSGYNNFTTEELPTMNDTKKQMQYYYESSHYKPELGDIILDRMFDGNFSCGQNYPDFGVKLTSQNIEAHLANLRIQRAKYRASHPQDIAEIEALKKAK